LQRHFGPPGAQVAQPSAAAATPPSATAQPSIPSAPAAAAAAPLLATAQTSAPAVAAAVAALSAPALPSPPSLPLQPPLPNLWVVSPLRLLVKAVPGGPHAGEVLMAWTAETWPFLLAVIVEHLTTSPLLRCLVSWPCELLWPLLCKNGMPKLPLVLT